MASDPIPPAVGSAPAASASAASQPPSPGAPANTTAPVAGTPPAATTQAPGEFDALYRYLIAQSRKCLRPPVDLFRHSWIAPMPLSPASEAYLKARTGAADGGVDESLARPDTGDGFKSGDYSLGLFHHDASEAAIELLRHEEFREAACGSLLCLLDSASPDGRIPRAALPHKAREHEPARPVIAQFALRAVRALGAAGPEWATRNRVFPRVARFLQYLELNYTGLHGLFLTHSSLASGFDSDLLTAQFADKTVEAPDVNAFMVLEYRAMADLAALLGQPAANAEYEEKAENHRSKMEQLLWHEDDAGGFYRALRWQHGVGALEAEVVGIPGQGGRLRPLEGWTTLLPIYAGVPGGRRAKMVAARVTNPNTYWGPVGVRTAPLNDLFFHQAPRVMLYDQKKAARGPVSNWWGPVWVLSNYYLATGLAKCGQRERAKELALKTARLLSASLTRDGSLAECYDDQGRGLWPRGGSFISWNVLALTLLRDHVPEVAANWSNLRVTNE